MRSKISRLISRFTAVIRRQSSTLCLAILSVFVDPTTAGIGDSKTALGYDKPNREEND